MAENKEKAADTASDAAPVMEAIYHAFLTASRRRSDIDRDFLAAFSRWSNGRAEPIDFTQGFIERYKAAGDSQMAAWLKTMYDHFQAVDKARPQASKPAPSRKPPPRHNLI